MLISGSSRPWEEIDTIYPFYEIDYSMHTRVPGNHTRVGSITMRSEFWNDWISGRSIRCSFEKKTHKDKSSKYDQSSLFLFIVKEQRNSRGQNQKPNDVSDIGSCSEVGVRVVPLNTICTLR